MAEYMIDPLLRYMSIAIDHDYDYSMVIISLYNVNKMIRYKIVTNMNIALIRKRIESHIDRINYHEYDDLEYIKWLMSFKSANSKVGNCIIVNIHGMLFTIHMRYLNNCKYVDGHVVCVL